MRQAGRYLAEYRAIREKVSFLELCRDPELIAEVVRQPVHKFGLDAAILFSDILIILEPLGATVTFEDGGPELSAPIVSPNDVKRLHDFDVKEHLNYVYDGIREIKKILPDTPLLGFAGSPFTIACYLIEGKGSKNFDSVKEFIHRHPAASERIFELVTDITARYLDAQIEAGCDAIQLFDSWGGILSRDDYREWSLRWTRAIFERIEHRSVPRILFVNNLAPYIDLVRDLNCEVIGVDYRMDLRVAADALPGKSIQGNLDPAVLFGSHDEVAAATRKLLDSLDNHDRLIFNLGHGIRPATPVESVEALVETVHSYR
jgi:uroporphyrinogen decarboxylase